MGSSFVNIGERGFWMRDGLLEIWLRLLALHLEQPRTRNAEVGEMRDRFLLSSGGGFIGCIPHRLGDAVATAEGADALRRGILALLAALAAGPNQIPAVTLNLLAVSWTFQSDIAASDLIEIGHAFIDLMDGRIAWTAADAPVLPLYRAGRG